MSSARVRNGATKKEALTAEGISESFFGRKRCIAEAARIDLPSLRHGLLQLINPTLKTFYQWPGTSVTGTFLCFAHSTLQEKHSLPRR